MEPVEPKIAILFMESLPVNDDTVCGKRPESIVHGTAVQICLNKILMRLVYHSREGIQNKESRRHISSGIILEEIEDHGKAEICFSCLFVYISVHIGEKKTGKKSGQFYEFMLQ